jgi:hypothetical protein
MDCFVAALLAMTGLVEASGAPTPMAQFIKVFAALFSKSAYLLAFL